MKPLDLLTAETILEDQVFIEIFDQEDEIAKARLIMSLETRAQQLGVRRKFQAILNAYKRVDRESRQKKRKQSMALVENWTNFDGPYDRMQCKNWVASDEGIYTYNSGSGQLDTLACYHPILPVERLKNLETGEEQLKLAYKRNSRWSEVIVPKTMVASASKIVSLSARGIAVTSENAKYLVRYLADVENANDDYIGVQYSSSKLGWIKNEFLPYDTAILFDGDSRFRQVFDSISESGSRELWYSHVKELRKAGRMEVKFMLAASFSSVLIHILGGLPYFVDLWGETEGGKTVTLMLAASIWANPSESSFIGDFKATDVALEAKADMLNHLPMILDDTSKTSARIRDNFEGVIYDLCSGKGKSRSNKELGINRENRWCNAILTNGERPLASYANQGGAINRILEIECGEKVYADPQGTADILKKNYGFAGKEFVQVLKDMGAEGIRKLQQGFQRQLFDDEKMQKQSISLSVILTADKIATDALFKDGQYISVNEAKKALIDRKELSDNERCYAYLLDKVAMNPQRFDPEARIEQWGALDGEYAIIYNSAFAQLCQDGGFSKKSFLSWADRNGLIQKDSVGNYAKQKKINGRNNRCVFLRLDNGADQDGFIPADEKELYAQEELPFR